MAKPFVKGTTVFKEIPSGRVLGNIFRRSILRRQFKQLPQKDIEALNKMVIRIAGPEGWTFVRPGEPREINLSDLPELSNNRQPEDMTIVFGANQGEGLLQGPLSAYKNQYPRHGDFVEIITSHAYERIVKDPTQWDIRAYVLSIIKKGPTLSGFPEDLTIEVAAQEAPTLFPNLNILSLREYVIKHGFLFPSYTSDKQLLPTVLHAWRRLIAGELTPEANNMLVQSYFYSLNTRDIKEIVTEAENFVQENGRFPGFDTLTLSPEEIWAYIQADGASQLTAEELDEITLGMQASLVAKGVPNCDWLWDTLPTTLKMRINQLTLSMVAH